jgi:endonuclease/exonuclease/phosphatase (EEP) superfamily protein YafD
VPAILRDIANGSARVVTLAGLFALVLTVCGQLLGTLWWPFELAAHATLYSTLALSAATPLLLCKTRHRRVKLGVLCALALAWNSALLLPLVAPSMVVVGRSARLRVMTLNVLTRNMRHGDVLQLVESEDPDVLSLIEVNDRWLDAMSPLGERYSTVHSVPRGDNFGMAFYSRLPVDSIETLELCSAQVPSIAATIRTAGRSVTILATHPLPPIGAERAGLRNEQLAAVAEWAREQENPVIVMGDLNVTPWSPYFRSLLRRGKLKDSGYGFGIHSTWRPGSTILGIPIDHVLHSPELLVLSRHVGPEVGSDHKAVVVELMAR